MQNVIEQVSDNKQAVSGKASWADKRQLAQKIEQEQKVILNDLKQTLKQNYRQDKYTNYGLKNENMINAFITDAVND